MRCEDEKTFTGIFPPVHYFSWYQIDFSLCQIDFRCVSKSTYTCVETTLYWNKCKTSQIRPRLHCTYNVMHFGNNTTWQRGHTKEHSSFIYNLSASQRNYSTSWQLELGIAFSKWIIRKAKEVRGKWFFQFRYFWIMVMIWYQKLSLLWNPRAWTLCRRIP